MITFLVEDDPSPEKEIWITASTMFRFCHLSHLVLRSRCYWLVRFLLSGFQVLILRCLTCGRFLTANSSTLLLCVPTAASIDTQVFLFDWPLFFW